MDDENLLKTITVKVELDKLKLDLNNARFQHLPEKIDETKMEELIWSEKDTRQLYEQIRTAKGLYEPPVINSDNIVIEGNRRLVCLRKLKVKLKSGEITDIESDRFDHVECRQIPKNTPKLNVDLFLASIHVRGKKPWPAYNKAKRIQELRLNYDYSYDRLAKTLGMGKITLIRMVNAYEQMEKYREKYDDDKDWYRKYTHFDEFFSSRGLKEFRGQQKNIDKFSAWVHEGKFSDSRHVRSLSQILGDDDAFKAFEEEDFDAAIKLLEEKNPTMKSREFRQISKTIRILHDFSRKELVKTVKDQNRLRLLKELRDETDSLIKDVENMNPK
ncbi:hypothetical protein HY989_03090 [Candidatus Micrarchaeota archaeon]|nr:hypothetical protein [Candidatus Micrarchaeota archaeon]